MVRPVIESVLSGGGEPRHHPPDDTGCNTPVGHERQLLNGAHSFGGDEARIEIEGPDPHVAVFKGDHVGDPMEACLGHRVRQRPPTVTHRVPRGELGGTATDVEQQSSPATDHVGDDALGQQQLRGHVAEDATGQLLGFGLEEPGPPSGADVERVVHEQVQVAQADDGGVDCRCQRVLLEQVERDGDGTTAARLDGRAGGVETARERRSRYRARRRWGRRRAPCVR